MRLLPGLPGERRFGCPNESRTKVGGSSSAPNADNARGAQSITSYLRGTFTRVPLLTCVGIVTPSSMSFTQTMFGIPNTTKP